MPDSCNRKFTPLQLARLGFVAVYLGFALLVLTMGGLAAWANASDSFHESLHEWGLGTSLFARAAFAMGDASHGAQPLGQLAIDYGFTLFNLALAGLLLFLRPKDRTAVLLAVGMIGTAAVFNLQAYSVYEAFPNSDAQEGLHHFFQLTAAISYIFALLLFPDGRLPPRGWGWKKAIFYVPLIGLVSWQAFRQQGTNRTIAVILYFGLLTPIAGVLGQAYRSRRSLDPVERQQSRLLFWALVPAVLLALFVLTRQVQDTAFETYQGRQIEIVPVAVFRVFQVVFALIPVALFIGILRYKLWNIERVISRALLYGILAGFVTAVYVAVVVVIGGLIGSQQDGNNLWLSILATGIVAVAFQPVKDRVDRLANLLVYGKRATPYEVLSELAARMGEALATDDLLAKMARVIAEGTAAARADVWLVVGNEMRPACSWPARDAGPGSPPEPLPLPLTDGDGVGVGGDQDLPAIPNVTMSVPVRHHGEPLGALAVTKPAGETLAPTEAKLLADVASQAGLMLRNVRLNAELVLRLEELRASRVRLLATQDEARRRLERNLHDGAQQQLVALKVMVGLAEQVAAAGQPIGDILVEIRTNASDALENLRDLARGIYPPLLAAEGLPTALRGQATRVPFNLVVEEEHMGRYPQEVEAAVYFCCLEAFQNAAKHAQASTVTVRLVGSPADLRFTVSDDGQGCDLAAARKGSGLQNMADRMDALEGTLDLRSSPGGGTVVEGWVPCAPLGAAGGGAPTDPAPAAQEGRPEGTPLKV